MTDHAPPEASSRRRWPRRLAVCAAALRGGAGSHRLLVAGHRRRDCVSRSPAPVSASHGTLSVGGAQGRLIGPLTLHDVRYQDGEGTDIRLADARVDLAFWPLLRKRLHVRTCRPTASPWRCRRPRLRPKAPADSACSHRWTSCSIMPTWGGCGSARPASRCLLPTGSTWPARGPPKAFGCNQVQLAGPDGHLSLDGTLAAGTDYRGNGKADFAWMLGDTIYAGTTQAHQ